MDFSTHCSWWIVTSDSLLLVLFWKPSLYNSSPFASLPTLPNSGGVVGNDQRRGGEELARLHRSRSFARAHDLPGPIYGGGGRESSWWVGGFVAGSEPSLPKSQAADGTEIWPVFLWRFFGLENCVFLKRESRNHQVTSSMKTMKENGFYICLAFGIDQQPSGKHLLQWVMSWRPRRPRIWQLWPLPWRTSSCLKGGLASLNRSKLT